MTDTVLVTDRGFSPDDLAGAPAVTLADLVANPDMPGQGLVIDMPNDRDPAALAPFLDRAAVIRVAFPGMGDGRGFSIARRLRAMGYSGRLRARGPLIADQARAARRVGFDEIEIPEELARRQPEALWLPRPAPSYRDHVFAG